MRSENQTVFMAIYSLLQCQSSSGSVGESVWLAFGGPREVDLFYLYWESHDKYNTILHMKQLPCQHQRSSGSHVLRITWQLAWYHTYITRNSYNA